MSALLSQAQNLPSPTPSLSNPRESTVTEPELFSGQSNLCRVFFLFQCTSVFQLKPVSFFTDSSKTKLIRGLLRGKDLAWAEARFFSRCPVNHTTYPEFIKEFKKVYDHPDYQVNASLRLMSLSQGHRSISYHSIEFWTLTTELDWTEDSLKATNTWGLN